MFPSGSLKGLKSMVNILQRPESVQEENDQKECHKNLFHSMSGFYQN